ncbi:MAG TPA: hypothetical protein VIA18_00045, partial [Polyangia bacterium]|nr:hypothetical protein [Polyangia bacterium]
MRRIVVPTLALLAFGCIAPAKKKSGTQTNPPKVVKVAIGGSVSGLSGHGLVLQNSGGDALTITDNGGFTFATSIATGTAYAVTVAQQPSAPTQQCV